MVIKIPKEKIEKIDIINIEGGITAGQVYSKYKPDFLINLALYDTTSKQNITNLKDEGIVSGYLFSDEGIGIKNDNEIVWTTKNDKNVRDFVAGSPILVKNGQKSIDWGNKYSTYLSGVHNRSVIGFNDNEVILFNSEKKMDLNELSQTLISEKCKYAINLDGGGSCHLQKGDLVYKKSTRKNVSWLLIYIKEVEEDMKAELQIDNKIITVNGNRKVYDTAPFIKNGRTYVPVRFLEDMGFSIDWIASERKVIITKED